MGSVYLRVGKKSSTWWIDYTAEGQRIREKVGRIKDGVTERQAKEALKAREGDIVKGKFGIAQTKKYPYFRKLMDKYFIWSEVNKKSSNRDRVSYKHLEQYFGKKRIHEINAFLIERYKKKRKDEIMIMKKNIGKSDKDISFVSINRELALLKHFYTLAIKWGAIDKNPVKGIKMFKEMERERFLTESEITALLQACEKSKNRMLKTIVVTAISTGARLSEILSLKVKDLDFRNAVINLEHTKNGDRGKVPMTDYLKKVLQEHFQGCDFEYLFSDNKGKPFKSIKTSFKRALKIAAIRDFRFHDLRHTFASHLAMNGISGNTLQKLGRWKSPKMVMKYAHLSAEHMQKSINSLDGLCQERHKYVTNLIPTDFSRESQNG